MAKTTVKAKTVKTSPTAKKVTYTTEDASQRLSGMLPARVIGTSGTRMQTLVSYDKILNQKHVRAMFKAGSTISRKDLLATFNVTGVYTSATATGTYEELQRQNLQVVGLVRDINDVLNHSGLHLRSKGYYSEFHVDSKADAKKTLERYNARIERLEAREEIFEANLKDRAKTKKNYGETRKAFRKNGTCTNPLKVIVTPNTIDRANKAFNRVIHF